MPKTYKRNRKMKCKDCKNKFKNNIRECPICGNYRVILRDSMTHGMKYECLCMILTFSIIGVYF